ncbi:MAG: PilZ domain-containing protein [Thermoanaerobaculia bacterium]
MKPEDPPEESTIRRDTRVPLVAPVKIEYTVDKTTRSTYTTNVSLDGLFILVSNPKPVGTKLGFELQIQRERQPIKGFGEVRWIRVRGEGPGRPAGMGVLIQMMIGEEGEAVLREAIAGALKAGAVTGAPVPAPALDVDSAEAKEALAKARRPAPPPEGAPAGPAAGRVGRPPVRKFEYGMHAQRSAELRSQRLGKKKGSGLDEFMSKMGFSSRIYLLVLPILLLLLILVVFMIF